MTSRSASASRKSPAQRKPNGKKSTAKTSTAKLPEWNLADLYSGIDAPEIADDLARLTAECVADAGGAVLRVHIEPGPAAGLLGVVLQKFSPMPAWGEHPLDISLVQGNIIDLMARQTQAWLINKGK